MKLTINIDGGSRGNPGPAAYGCYIQGAGSTPIQLKGRLGTTTNNIAEYHGLIRALEKAVELGATEVHILADSELLVRQMTGVYRVKNEHLAKLFEIATDLVKQIGNVYFKHVYREQNTIADALCNEALDDPSLPKESLGLKEQSSTRTKPKHHESPSQTVASSQNEYAKVKLAGNLLTLLTIKKTTDFAVVVHGTSWKLSLPKLPAGIHAGDQVVVLGNLEYHRSQPLIKVKSIRKA